ncbi:MAG: LysR family transcriptional regulator [Pseudomonadota bacterium]
MLPNLVPRSLRYIEAVAEHGSIQAAARETDISASAIDRQIKIIEDRMGVLLFDRQTRGMELSPAGEIFVALAQKWRADERRIQSEVKRMQGVDFGHIRLATMDSLVNGLVPRFLGTVSRKYPRVRIDVEVTTPDDAPKLLEDGGCDIALCFNLLQDRKLHRVWSEELPLFCVVAPSHPLSRSSAVAFSDLINQAIVLQSRALSIRRLLEKRHAWLFEQGPPPVVTNSLQLLKQLVATGSHLALTSEMDAAPELLSGGLVAIPISGSKIPNQTISVAVSARRALPRITGLIGDCLAHEANHLLSEVRTIARSPKTVTDAM